MDGKDKQIMLVGGPHDGKLMKVPTGMECVKMPNPKMTEVSFDTSHQWTIAESFEVLFYDDCGDHTRYHLRKAL